MKVMACPPLWEVTKMKFTVVEMAMAGCTIPMLDWLETVTTLATMTIVEHDNMLGALEMQMA